jgi:hypothetical protein
MFWLKHGELQEKHVPKYHETCLGITRWKKNYKTKGRLGEKIAPVFYDTGYI